MVSSPLYPAFALDKSQTCDTSILPPRWPSSHIYITDTNESLPYIPLTDHTAIFHDDDVWNTSTQPRSVHVTLTIQDQDTKQQVFNQTQSLQMQACSGPESVKWRFIPMQVANYIATVSDNRGNVGMIFKSMLDASKSQTVSLPLEQLRFGVDSHNIICRQDLQLVIKSEDGSPACVKPDTATILRERGWATSIITTPPALQQTSGNPTLPASFMPCDTPFPQSNTGIPVLYMSTNSIGKICVTYSNPNDTAQSISTAIAIHDPNISYQQVPDISTWIVYGFPTIPGKGNSTFVYEIKTGNQTGFYLLDLTCGGKPFAVVNDNKSKIIASDFPFIGTGSYCPSLSYSVHLDGTTGIGVRYIPQK